MFSFEQMDSFKISHALNLSDYFPHALGCFFVDVHAGKRFAKFQG
jgi:hypothetical protein